ncbi:hypothetical protein Mal15_47040 [Stieleria maiorica]|uniref:Uncharacterized protein n=1 Tax=Stieleria maiorica TaxID=2795974 RepID=A0A5B9MH84_9BACT|nr:hypothetical protein [Stieleria maiorica]QEG00633.1 hypothetical protein Mal15_47040 [Stieleria maiorica]
MTRDEFDHDRRQWLVRVGRYALLGGMSVLTLNLLRRANNLGCVQLTSPCQTCGLFKKCGLPKADQARQPAMEGEPS